MSDLDTHTHDRAEVSIVAPMFNEAENIQAFVSAVTEALSDLNFEIVLVDDGSSDSTWARITELAAKEPRLRGLRLSRNFGHQSAIFAGMTHATGRAIVTMDGDLQHPPSVVRELVHAWRAGNAVVNTERVDSADTSAFKRLTSRWFYSIFSWLSGVPLRRGSSDFRLIDERVMRVLEDMGDRDLFLRGLINWLGFPTTTVTFAAAPRHAGTTKFSLRKMLRFSAAGLLGFSTLPLRLGTWAGFVTSLLALAEIAYIIIQYLRGITVPGWASVMTLMSLFFAVLFLLLGMIGVYLARIYEILKHRPRHVVSERAGFPAKAET